MKNNFNTDKHRKMSDTAPRNSRQPGCPLWCYQTLNLLAMGWQSYEIDVERIAKYYESICVFKAWEKIPVEKPYGSKEALLKAELGIEDEDFYKALAKKVSANTIRDARKTLHKELVEDHGMSYREAAKVTNSSLGTVHADVCSENDVRTTETEHSDDFSENSVYTQKTEKEPRKHIRVTVYQSTKPTTAAQKIRATFGDDFAIEMMRAMQLELDQEVTR